MQLTTVNIKNNKTTVVVGLVRPSWVKELEQDYTVRNIKFCLLDISVRERAQRLKERQASSELIKDLEEHKNLKSWIKKSGYENIIIDTSNLTPEEIVDKIQAWVR